MVLFGVFFFWLRLTWYALRGTDDDDTDDTDTVTNITSPAGTNYISLYIYSILLLLPSPSLHTITPVGHTTAGLPSGPPSQILVTERRPANGSLFHKILDVVHNIY